MKPVIVIVNGPNLNRLGVRRPDIYGSETMDNVLRDMKESFPQVRLAYRQANGEGDLIDILQGFAFDPTVEKPVGIVFNPGAYAHYSYALADAVADVVTDAGIPLVEVHITNIHAREPHRAVSVIAPSATAVIAGLGTWGYSAAVEYLLVINGQGT